ncbi:MAG: response regulator [Desulfurivibrio sp.]|nr:response regulator [Desulfurivibrio sp.]
MTAEGQKILLVDDEESFRQRLATAFSRRGFTVLEAGDYDQAVAVIQRDKPALAVIDLRMPGKSGLELVAAARRLDPELAMVMLTGYGSIATATEAIRLGASAYLPKPANVDDILRAFQRQSEEAAPETDHDFPAPSLARAEWEHINRVLTDCHGNISHAAERLGLHRRTLQRKLQKLPPRQ